MPDTPLNPDGVLAATEAIYALPLGIGKVMAERYAQEAVSAYLAVAQPEVNSLEELDALPVGSLIMMSGVVAPFLHTDDGWESTRTPGKPVWDYTNNPHYFPARVLYRPEVKP